MKLWAKVLDENVNIVSHIVMRNQEALTRAAYERFLSEICQQLDLSTPVTLPTHFNHLRRFNIVEYRARDFLEPVDFFKFTIENVDYEE